MIKESLDQFGQAKKFTQLDLTNAYYQIKIKERDKWKTVFWTRYDYFKYQMILFGLSNAWASFQGYITKILAEKLDIFVIIYLDNIFIYTNDQGRGYIEVVQCLLDLLKKNSLLANLKKCRFHKDEMRFLEYIVLSQGIWIEDKRIKVIRNWLKPKPVENIQVFIDFANFVMSWSRDLQITGYTSSFSPPLWALFRITSLLLQSHCIDIILPLVHVTLIILTSWNKAAMKLADQTVRREDQTPAETLVV